MWCFHVFTPLTPLRFGHTFSAERDLFVCLHNGHLFICLWWSEQLSPPPLGDLYFGNVAAEGIYWQIVAANASKVRLLCCTRGSFQFTFICIFAGESRIELNSF